LTKNIAKRLINQSLLVLTEDREIDQFLDRFTYKEKIEFILYRVSRYFFPKNDVIVLNFLVTSKAEIRVFLPILHHIIKRKRIKVNLVFLSSFRFSPETQKKIVSEDDFTEIYLLGKLLKYSTKNILNIVCLDHVYHYKHHRIGVDAISVLNSFGYKSVCLQHGSTRDDNVVGHISSASHYQVVYGGYLYKRLNEESQRDSDKIFITGNPLHDVLVECDADSIYRKIEAYFEIQDFPHNRKIIVLGTCLHSEYDDRLSPTDLYRKYIRKIYESIDSRDHLLLIKMHPMDDEIRNLYEEELISKDGVLIIPSGCDISIYELITIADLVMTRASSVAEEAVILGKKTLAFDLFEDGPANGLRALKSSKYFDTAIGTNLNLKGKIIDLLNSPDITQDGDEGMIDAITYKLDGRSTERVVNTLVRIASF